MEDLNKNQIILLTLLVSFVTSIATGIMTVSLLNQAPVEVTRNINSIVEKTIERVTPANVLSSVASNQKEVTTTTIVVNEDDSVTQSIAKNAKSIVRINEKDGLTSDTSFYGIGLVMNKEGIISADRKTITFINIYTATMSDGVEFKLIPVGVDKNTNFILFKANIPVKTTYTFVPITLSDSEPKLGQTLISLGGNTANTVSVGRAISLEMKESGIGTSTVKYISSIITDVSSKDLVDGSPILNLSGEVVGVKLGNNELKSFTPILVLKNELNTLEASIPKAQ